MTIRPEDIHSDIVKARFAVETVAMALGIECDCSFISTWTVKVSERESKSFMELVRERIP